MTFEVDTVVRVKYGDVSDIIAGKLAMVLQVLPKKDGGTEYVVSAQGVRFVVPETMLSPGPEDAIH